MNNFAVMKDEVRSLTANLRKHNFSFGEEKVANLRFPPYLHMIQMTYHAMLC